MDGDTPEIRRPSRAEAEMLCMMLALGDEACTLLGLTSRLGLTEAHAAAVEEAYRALVSLRCVELRDARFAATRAGLEWLASRMRELRSLMGAEASALDRTP